MERLSNLVEIEENNQRCVLLKVKENVSMLLIKLGCFEGEEKFIRLTKGEDHTCTIFTDSTDYSWYWGISGSTLVSENLSQKAELILECIEQDFDIYIGSDKTLIEKSLKIHSKDDVYNIPHEIEIMYWKNDKSVVVHKDGNFCDSFSEINSAKKYFNNLNYKLTFEKKYVAPTGCIVEKYSMIKEKEKVIESTVNNELEEDSEFEGE